MQFGSPFSKAFIAQFSDKEMRDEFVADRVRTRIALAVKALREQADRGWSQEELGDRAGKLQSTISRIEDPDYGRHSLQTLLEIASAFDLPLLVEFTEWDEWLTRTSDFSNASLRRQSFDAEKLSGGSTSTSAEGRASPIQYSVEYPHTSANSNHRLTSVAIV